MKCNLSIYFILITLITNNFLVGADISKFKTKFVKEAYLEAQKPIKTYDTKIKEKVKVLWLKIWYCKEPHATNYALRVQDRINEWLKGLYTIVLQKDKEVSDRFKLIVFNSKQEMQDKDCEGRELWFKAEDNQYQYPRVNEI